MAAARPAPAAAGTAPSGGQQPAGLSRLLRPSLLGVGAVALVVWGLSAGLRPLDDNSFLTHLATGRLILDHGIPTADPFSFTAPGTDWVVQSWLASAVYAGLEELAGARAIIVLNGLLAATLAGLVVRLTRPAVGLTGRLAVAALAIGIGVSIWVERPLLIGLVLFATTMVIVEERRHPALLVPVMWIWANSHGSFPLGLVFIATVVAGNLIDRDDPGPAARALGWAAAGTVLSMVNPLGPELLLFPLELLRRQDVLQGIVEWQAPRFLVAFQRLFLLEVALAVILLVRRPRYRDAVPLVVFAIAGVLAARNIAVASLVLVPVLARGVAGWGSLTGERRSPVTAAAGVVVVALGGLLVADALREPAFQLRPYPVAALAWLDDNGLAGNERRVVTQDFVGNLRDLVHGSEAAIFIDDRYDMWPEDLVDDYGVLLRGEAGWRRVLDRHDAEVVLWERDRPLGALLVEADDWGVVRVDDGWLVAVRRPGDGPA